MTYCEKETCFNFTSGEDLLCVACRIESPLLKCTSCSRKPMFGKARCFDCWTRRSCLVCDGIAMFASNNFCLNCCALGTDYEVASQGTWYSGFNSEDHDESVHGDYPNDCTHFCEYRAKSEAHVLEISYQFEPLLIDDNMVCSQCDRSIVEPFPLSLGQGFLPGVLVKIVIEYLGPDTVVIHRHGALEHSSCATEQSEDSVLFSWEKSLCDICCTPIAQSLVYFNSCQCLMDQVCFDRAISKKEIIGTLDRCPSRKHVECKPCFWCSY
jgi:hypothetical protein